MKSKYETLCEVVEYVKNESYNPIAELLFMGFTPAQLVHEFAFDEEKVKACPLFLKAEENLEEKLEATGYPQILSTYSPFDAGLMEHFHLSKEQMYLLKETDLYRKMKETYRQEKAEAHAGIMYGVCARFTESLAVVLKTEATPNYASHKVGESEYMEAIKGKSSLDKRGFLTLCLNKKAKLPMDGIKAWEYAIQQVLEKLSPNKEWYELTNVSIFMELLGGKLPITVCEQVWEDIKDKLPKEENFVKKESLEDMILHAKPPKGELRTDNIKHNKEFTL